MKVAHNIEETEPIHFFNGTRVCKSWKASGYIESRKFPNCICISRRTHSYEEVHSEGRYICDWKEGEIQFFPASYLLKINYERGAGELGYIEMPDSIIAQAMPIEQLRVHRKMDDAIMRHIITALHGLAPDDDPLLMESLVVSAVHRVAQWHGRQFVGSDRHVPRITRSVEYMQDNLAEPITLDELAGVAHMSPFHFARHFHRVTGRSPHAYLVQKRIEKAKGLLLAGAVTVATVAYACGFGSHAQFSRQFRAHTGITPVQYRQQAGRSG